MRAIFVTVRMKPEYRDRILKGALEDGRGSREDEPGCLRFDVIQDDNDPNTIYFYEVYKDEAAFQEHTKQPHMIKWRDTTKDWTAKPTEAVRAHSVFPRDDAWKRQG